MKEYRQLLNDAWRIVLFFSSFAQMWREQAGFLEMFLAYYAQCEENVLRKKTYTEFLFNIICAHESLT